MKVVDLYKLITGLILIQKANWQNHLGAGIDIHWEWYQPLRNDFGFVMFLGHGAF